MITLAIGKRPTFFFYIRKTNYFTKQVYAKLREYAICFRNLQIVIFEYLYFSHAHYIALSLDFVRAVMVRTAGTTARPTRA